MNYFELHLGDYAEATAHLTFIEDAAYGRMLRKYYSTEKPLPVDLKQVQRLVGARTKEEREAVETVLNEFFTLQDDGWHNARCDAEIARFKDGEPEREVKKANEENRLKRHREERARLFKRLTENGQHAPWNIGMNELRALVKALPATEPETHEPPLPATAPATPATATQTPDTNHQTPVLQPNDNDDSTDSGYATPSSSPLPEPEAPPENTDPAIALAVSLRKLGVDATFTHPAVLDWVQREINPKVLQAAVALAREQKGPTAKIPPNYLVPIVEKVLNPPATRPPVSYQPHHASPPIEMRRPLKPRGMEPKGTDESYEEYQARIQAAEAAARKALGQ